MELQEIVTTNFYILNDIIQVQKENSQLPLMRDISGVLNRVVITLELSNVRLLELIGLRKYGTLKYSKHPKSESIESVKTFVDALHLENGSDNFFYSLQDCFFECPMVEDEKRTILDYRIMPIGFPEFDCALTITGDQILNLYGYDFYKITKIIDPKISLEENIERNIYSALYDGLYKNIIQENTLGNDITTGAWLNQNIYHKFQESFVLSSIIGDRGNQISLIDTDPDTLMKQIKSAAEIKNETYKVEIICYTSLSIYYYLKLFTDIYISDLEDMSVVMLDDAKLESCQWSEKADKLAIIYNSGYIKYDCIKSADILTNLFMLPANRMISYTIIVPDDRLDHIQSQLDNTDWIIQILKSTISSGNLILNKIK